MELPFCVAALGSIKRYLIQLVLKTASQSGDNEDPE
jgi:hypothetical protein